MHLHTRLPVSFTLVIRRRGLFHYEVTGFWKPLESNDPPIETATRNFYTYRGAMRHAKSRITFMTLAFPTRQILNSIEYLEETR